MYDRDDRSGRSGRPEGRPDLRVRRKRPADISLPPPRRPFDFRRRADELTAAGMPFQMAVAVAQGRLPLNEALERLARVANVERIMKEHAVTRALATQIVMGHADLSAFLAKRRFEEHRAVHLETSCFDKAKESGVVTAFALFGQRRVEARVVDTSAYLVTLQEEGKEPEQVHKLDLKYAYLPDDWKKLKKVIRKDKALVEHPKRPAKHPQDRYTCSDRRLFRYSDEQVVVDVALLEGEILHGQIVWFSRFEFGLGLKGGGDVTVFRHALHRISDGD